MWGAIASAAIGAIGARKTAKAMRGANDLDLGKLRREAEQNGFNPLTVLRATGGQGSTKGASGGLASGAFFQTFAQGIPSIFEANYNKKMKDAQYNSAITNTAYTKALTKDLTNKVDAYAKYDRWIPVRLGNQTKEMDMSVAKRLGILPGDTVSPGDLEEMLGEIHGNLTSGIATEIQEEVIKGGVLSGYGSVGSVQNLNTGKLKSDPDYSPGAIKTTLPRDRYGMLDIKDDPIFQWTQDFFNDAKRVFKENHGS